MDTMYTCPACPEFCTTLKSESFLHENTQRHCERIDQLLICPMCFFRTKRAIDLKRHKITRKHQTKLKIKHKDMPIKLQQLVDKEQLDALNRIKSLDDLTPKFE